MANSANSIEKHSTARITLLIGILLFLFGSWLFALWLGGIESDQKSLRTFIVNADDFDDSIPTPALPPTEVVQMQLDSMRQSDTNPRALVVCYSLASPENRQATGPYSRFASMLRTPPYDQLMLNKDYVVGSPTVVGDEAMVPVSIASGKERAITFRFLLRKQSVAPYQGCWMTEGVSTVTEEALSPSLPTTNDEARE